MNLLCLVPTYGRPRLVENAVALFERQDYPLERRKLLIFDDANQIPDGQQGDGWRVVASDDRWHCLPAKYNSLLTWADELWPDWYDAAIVWDDDDVYMPWHLSAYAEAMQSKPWAHPRRVWSTYTGKPELERADGRFHGSLAVRRDLLKTLRGWRPETRRADFDQRMIGECHRVSMPGRPDAERPPSYVFRWADTQAAHCQGLMKSPSDETWYERCAVQAPQWHGPLTPQLDASAEALLAALASPAAPSAPREMPA